MTTSPFSTPSLRSLRIFTILVLVFLTVQGWTGDFSNLFAVFPSGTVSASIGGILAGVEKAGPLVTYHALEGALILALSIVVLSLSFSSHASSTLKVFAILGLGSVASALAGGVLFVLSDFQNNGNSAQMGGSFIGAYAFFFLVLYASKKK